MKTAFLDWLAAIVRKKIGTKACLKRTDSFLDTN